MKNMDIEFRDLDNNSDIKEINEAFMGISEHKIENANWLEFNYKPSVSFKAIYSKYGIYIKYRVLEQAVLAKRVKVNDPVYKDSCVEFFLSPFNNKYYNFEFNCIGTKYAGCGTGRADGTTLESETVNKIRTFPSLGRDSFNEKTTNKEWELVVEIPFSIFMPDGNKVTNGTSMRCNFYKCGDELKVPHYLSWSKIVSKAPDFHRPEFFGQINFI